MNIEKNKINNMKLPLNKKKKMNFQ